MAAASTTAPAELDIHRPYTLTPEQIERFREDGFIKLRDVFDGETLAYYGDHITDLVKRLNPLKDKPLESRDTYGKAFIQIENLWTQDEIAREFSFSRRLARLAAELMGVAGVRMWHDQALYKEAGGGFTPWHVDQYYWPMSSGLSITAWIPFQPVPLEMGPLCFGRGSHLKNIGRDLVISDESERQIREQIKQHGLLEVYEPYDLGEVSFHYGWTLHRAGPNTTGAPRRVHTVIYMDKEMRLVEPKNDAQKVDWQALCPQTKFGEVMEGPLTPILWPR